MKSPSISKHDSVGFSLIETLLTLAILALIIGAGISIHIQTLTRTNLAQERDMLVSLLETQRAEAMANIHEHTHGLHITDGTFILFEGVYDASNASNSVLTRNTHIHTGGDTTVTFTELGGESADGRKTITLTHDEFSATITVNEHGRIEW